MFLPRRPVCRNLESALHDRGRRYRSPSSHRGCGLRISPRASPGREMEADRRRPGPLSLAYPTARPRHRPRRRVRHRPQPRPSPPERRRDRPQCGSGGNGESSRGARVHTRRMAVLASRERRLVRHHAVGARGRAYERRRHARSGENLSLRGATRRQVRLHHAARARLCVRRDPRPGSSASTRSRAFAPNSGLHIETKRSFPMPRAAGRHFKYNEFVVVARSPA